MQYGSGWDVNPWDQFLCDYRSFIGSDSSRMKGSDLSQWISDLLSKGNPFYRRNHKGSTPVWEGIQAEELWLRQGDLGFTHLLFSSFPGSPNHPEFSYNSEVARGPKKRKSLAVAEGIFLATGVERIWRGSEKYKQ
jgi:hypothetical protein